MLVEKPLSDSLEGTDRLLEQCRKAGVVLQVGYCLRYDAALVAAREALLAGQIGRLLCLRTEVGQYLPDWRPDRDYRSSVSARADLGGGALLELSHEIDYAIWLGGAIVSVLARLGQVSDLDINVEDVADLLVEFGGGAIGQLHMDMIQQAPTRLCRLIGTHGTIEWDGRTCTTRVFDPDAGAWSILHQGARGDDAMYEDQLRHFLDCVGSGTQPRVSGEDGRRVLAVVEAARRASAEGREVSL